MANIEKREYKTLEKYIPKMMSESEIKIIVEKAINDSNAKNNEIGKVMSLVMKIGGDRIDGKIANEFVRIAFLDVMVFRFISCLLYFNRWVSGFENGIIEELGRLIGLTISSVITINFSHDYPKKYVVQSKLINLYLFRFHL